MKEKKRRKKRGNVINGMKESKNEKRKEREKK